MASQCQRRWATCASPLPTDAHAAPGKHAHLIGGESPMATLVGTFFHSHGGTTTIPAEFWREKVRMGRPVRADVPIEDDETNIKKCNRTHEGFRVLREKIA